MDSIRNAVRKVMHAVAIGLNTLSGGRLHPNVVTCVSLLMHIPIAYYIGIGRLELAALLLVIFGLFDTLDGELARLQKRASHVGMLLDSVTDRMKEVFLYGGIGFYLLHNGDGNFVVWAIFALGGSMLTTYINAVGDIVVNKAGVKNHSLNQGFRGGLMRFEIRMFFIVVALLADQLPALVVIIALLSWFTALQRLVLVMRKLRHV